MFWSMIKRLFLPENEMESAIAVIVPGSECNFCQGGIIPREISFMTKRGMTGTVKVCPKCVKHAKELGFIEAKGP